DAGAVLAAAIAERDLAGARDAAAVLDARLRHRLGALVPQPLGPWSAQVPSLADPERRMFTAEIAAMMDARKDRIGERAAGHAPTAQPDGTLPHLRDTYPIETAWAPRYIGDELRQVRAAAWQARLAALRATADARAAAQRGDHDQAERKRGLAASYQALHDA